MDASRSTSPSEIPGNPDALEAFYRAHIEEVQRFIARRVDDPHLAADLTAEVFLAVIDQAASYRSDRGEPGAWLTGIARNTVNNEWRRRGRALRATQRIQGRALLDVDSLSRIEERIDAEREARRINDAIRELKPADRDLLELVAVDGLDQAEAALRLGLRPGTARVRLHRARQRLDARLNQTGDTGFPEEFSAGPLDDHPLPAHVLDTTTEAHP